MRILIPTTEFPPAPGGVSTVAGEQANGLAALGHDVVVETLDFSKYGPVPYTAPGLTVNAQNIRAKAIIRLLPLAFHNIKTAKRFKPDVVLCPQYRGTGIPAVLAAQTVNCPCALYIHSTEIQTELNNPLRKTFVTYAMKHMQHFFFNSQNTRNLVRSWFPSMSIDGTVVYPGIKLTAADRPTENARTTYRTELLKRFGINVDKQQDAIIIGSMSRISFQKGIDLALKAISAIKATHPELKLYYAIAGIGPNVDDFKLISDRLNITDSVQFLGKIPEHEKPLFLSAIDMFTQFSRQFENFIEGFGISLVEAEMFGIPVISSDWGGIKEAVIKDETGFLLPVDDVSAIKQAIVKLATDPELRKTFGLAGMKHAAKFTWQKHIKIINDELTSLVEKTK